eukprot:TRINITY_DN2021_c0_g3_i2.p1 TRINITY_DN2021_c0_g3~~TRINITY_DN2021_c0_g3_i2.p1  ORF type:complete len:348 (-),score=27.86 TRINITY_DN2021_c0_g3_i2:932-1975(-)
MQKADSSYSKAKENAKMLNSLISSLHLHMKKPLNEHKSSTNVKNTKVSKLSFNNDEAETPKAVVASLRLHLKRKKSLRLGNNNLKARRGYPGGEEIAGVVTQREAATGQSFTASSYKKGSRSLRKNYESTSGGSKPGKNLSVNTSAASFAETSQTRCLTSRAERLAPTDLGTHEALQPGSTLEFPDYDPAKCSLKSNGIVKAYAVNTNQGIIRYFSDTNSPKGIQRGPRIDNTQHCQASQPLRGKLAQVFLLRSVRWPRRLCLRRFSSRQPPPVRHCTTVFPRTPSESAAQRVPGGGGVLPGAEPVAGPRGQKRQLLRGGDDRGRHLLCSQRGRQPSGRLAVTFAAT